MRAWNATIVAMLAVLAWVSPAPALAAGSYEVSACNFAPEAANNSWMWATNDPANPPHYAEHVNCPYRLGGSGGKADQEGGLSTTDALGLSSDAAPGTSAGWTFTAPAGTTITALTYERYIGHSLDPKNSWSPALRADGAIVPEETCLDTVENNETCSIGGPPGTGGEPARITGLSAHELSLGIVCQPPTGRECVTGATQHAVWATMYGATVTLSDPTPPTLSAPSGALWGPGEGGFHKGTESIAVSAQDVGGGVASVTLSVDGHPTETYSAPCNFTFSQPCPSSTGTQTLSLATSQLGDGKHSLTLVATDAAGNQSTVASEEITVDNSAPPAPVGLSATPVRSGSSTFTLTWGVPQVRCEVARFERTLWIGGLADVERIVPGSCSWPVPAPTCVASNGGVRSSGESPRAPVPSGGHRRGEDRTGELRESLLMPRQRQPRGWDVLAGCRDWSLGSGGCRSGTVPGWGEHHRPRGIRDALPGRSSCVRNVVTPSGSGPLAR